jgi:multisubunit Na+/H+ antiporter MnhB subunit
MYADEFTVAMAIIGFAFPFIHIASTTVSAKWFGPKGRNMATGILLLSRYIPVGVEVVLGTGFE